MPASAAASPDPHALRALLDGEHAAARDRIRDWLARPGNAPASDLPMEEHRTRVLAWARDLAASGDAAMGFPVQYGGEDAVGRSVAAFETLAFGDLSLLVKCGVQWGLFGGAVLHLGTARHHERHLRAITAMDVVGCFAMTETGHGSNVAALRTTATYDPATEEFVVHTPDDDARKDYIGNAARDAQIAAVFAQLVAGGEARGVHALLVPLRDERGAVLPGVRIEDCGAKLGLDGVDNGRIWFDSVRVPREALLDRYAQVAPDGTYTSPIENPTRRFFTMLATLVQGRVSICGSSINATKVALTIAVRRALVRRQFGPPDGEEALLLDYRTHQRRLLPALATTYALHFAQERLVEHVHAVFAAAGGADDRRRRELETLAAGLKAVATWHATTTIQACREACGGAGYLRANRFAALKADTDVFTTFEGDNTVLLQLVAKNLLTDLRDRVRHLRPLAMAAFVARQAGDAVATRTGTRGLAGRLAGRGDLRDRATQIALLRSRQEHVLGSVARRMKAGMDAGRDPFSVLVDCQDHLVAAAIAWVDLAVLEAFAGAVDRCADPAVRAVLDRVCSLHALHRIEAERGWYLELGRLTPARSKAVTVAVNALCAQVRDNAGLLVEAFGIPDQALGDALAVATAAEAVPA
jgi:acyl-CoA oxidase